MSGFNEDGYCKHRTVDRITAQWGLESVNGLVHCMLYLHLPLLEDLTPCVYTVYMKSVNYFGIIIIKLFIKHTTYNTININNIHEIVRYTGG